MKWIKTSETFLAIFITSKFSAYFYVIGCRSWRFFNGYWWLRQQRVGKEKKLGIFYDRWPLQFNFSGRNWKFTSFWKNTTVYSVAWSQRLLLDHMLLNLLLHPYPYTSVLATVTPFLLRLRSSTFLLPIPPQVLLYSLNPSQITVFRNVHSDWPSSTTFEMQLSLAYS